MPHNPHTELAEKYYVITRGVEIFKEPSDYEHFEELMCSYAKNFGITIHNYCLLDNDYHLLIEITTDNLSKFMRELNIHYSIYYHKKYKNVGDLWKGRFQSWVITKESHFYTLMCHIEQKPLASNSIKDITEYPYHSYHYFMDSKEVLECLKDSWIVQNYKEDKEAIKAFLMKPIERRKIQELRNTSLLEVFNTDKKEHENLKKYVPKKVGKLLTILLSVLFAVLLILVYTLVTKDDTKNGVNSQTVEIKKVDTSFKSETEQKNSSIKKIPSVPTREENPTRTVSEREPLVVDEEDMGNEDVVNKSQEEIDEEEMKNEDIAHKDKEEMGNEDMENDDGAYKGQEEIDDEEMKYDASYESQEEMGDEDDINGEDPEKSIEELEDEENDNAEEMEE